jgi:sigma-B regulation protein RsbU (phosphoserine phosphatase)
VTLAPGELLCLYTDGVTEAANGSGDEFGLERLKAFLCSQRGRDPVEVDANLAKKLEEHASGEPFGDDRTLLMVRRLPA